MSERTIQSDINAFLTDLSVKRGLIIGSITIFMIAGFISLLVTPPVYETKASFVLEHAPSFEPDQSPKAISEPGAQLATELEVLQSNSFLKQLTGALDLNDDPKLSRYVNEDGSIQHGESLYDALHSRIKLRTVYGTSVITVRFSSTNPDFSQTAADAVIKTYTDQRIRQNVEQQKRVNALMSRQLRELESQKVEAIETLNAYRQQNNLGDQDLSSLSLNQTTLEVSSLKQNLIKQEEQLKLIEDTLSHPGRLKEIAMLSTSPQLDNLIALEQQKTAEIADLATRYGSKHPSMQSAQAELRDIRARMTIHARSIMRSLENDIALAQSQINRHSDSVTSLQGEIADSSGLYAQLEQLQADVIAARQVYDSFYSKFRTLTANSSLIDSGVRVISYAEHPTSPVWPDPFIILGLAFGLGLLVSILIIILETLLKNPCRTPEDLKDITGANPIASIPAAHTSSKTDIIQYVLSNQSPALSEAIRTLRTRLSFEKISLGEKNRLAVMSAKDHDGKTSLAASLAAICAQTGDKAIIVDCNMRDPGLHTAFGRDNKKGLVDVLTNRMPLEEAIDKKHSSGLHILTTKAVPTHALALLDSAKFKTLLDDLSDEYDIVVLDTPSMMLYSDAQILSRNCDHILLLARSRYTTQDELETTHRLITSVPKHAEISTVLGDTQTLQGVSLPKFEVQNPRTPKAAH